MSCKQIIRDHGYGKSIKEVMRGSHAYTKVGFPLSGKLGEQSSAGESEKVESMTRMIAIVSAHEFGAPKRNLPERSFIRAAFDSNIERLNERKVIEYRKVLQGKQTVMTAIGRVGEFLTNETKAEIRNGLVPPLKVRVGGTPLWDTGQIINTIQHIETETKE